MVKQARDKNGRAANAKAAFARILAGRPPPAAPGQPQPAVPASAPAPTPASGVGSSFSAPPAQIYPYQPAVTDESNSFYNTYYLAPSHTEQSESDQIVSAQTQTSAGWASIPPSAAISPLDGMEGVDLGSLPAGGREVHSPLVSPQSPQQLGSQQWPSSQQPRPQPQPLQYQSTEHSYQYHPGSYHSLATTGTADNAYYEPARSVSEHYVHNGAYATPFSPPMPNAAGDGGAQARLLGAPMPDWNNTPPQPPMYSPNPAPARRKKWWHWRPAWIMYIFFLFGFFCALGHHLFYASLAGKPALDQLAMLRYGTILAFACKAGLVAAAVTAFRQRVWITVRKTLLSVAALDSLFAATEDLAALWNLEVYKRATVAMVLAIFVWLTPIVIILTSNTLGVENSLKIDRGMCPGVKTLNFDMEAREEWRKATKIDGLFGVSPNLWNKTAMEDRPEWYDYWTGPSRNIAATENMAILSQQVVGNKDAAFEACGPGWNCTYEVKFTGPGYKCTEIANGVDAKVGALPNGATPPFDTGQLLPKGNFSYLTHATEGEYSSAQMNDSWPGGLPKIDPPFPPHLGVFRTEPVIWTGYSVRIKDGPMNRTDAGWDDAFVPKIFGCQHYETAYTVLFNYTSGVQYTNVTSRDYLKPLIDTVFQRGVDANDGTNDNITAKPEENYVYPYPLDKAPAYRRIAAMHTMGFIFRDYVNGTLNSAQVNSPFENTKALSTKLLDPKSDWLPFPDLQPLMTSFYEDVVLSLFSNPQFITVVWAAIPDTISGVRKGNDSTNYPCVRQRNENLYAYHVRDLWIVYGLALLFSAVAVGLGTAAVLDDEGLLRDTRFSSIVAATRGPGLEKITWPTEEKGGHLPEDVKRMKVGYGVVHHRPVSSSGLGINSVPGTPGLGAATVASPPMPQEVDGAGVTSGYEGRYPERAVWDGGGGGSETRFAFGLEGNVRQTTNRRETRILRSQTGYTGVGEP